VKEAATGLEEEHLSPWMSGMHPTECYGQNIHNYTNVICCHAAGGLLVLLQGYTVLTWIFFLQMNTVTKVLCGGVDEGAKGDNEQTFHG
jgi:hypothetical protein